MDATNDLQAHGVWDAFHELWGQLGPIEAAELCHLQG